MDGLRTHGLALKLVAALLAALAGGALYIARIGPPWATPQPEPPAVSSRPPAGAVRNKVSALGRLEPKDGLRRISGPSSPSVVIAKLLVDEGDIVKAGQVVADAENDPALGELEAHLDERGLGERAPETTLVLRWKSEIHGTARWLDRRRVARHRHVRASHPEDIARLARGLTGNAVGVVLGGGGARGFAHLGVLKALEEVGAPVDLIGGTSIGAVIAGAMAIELTPTEARALAKRQFSALFDPTLPVIALLAGRRINARIEQAFGGLDIEDLPIPFFCISTNLTRATQVVHQRGPLARAIRASISLPGILPPSRDEGDLLVDGGLVNNVPVDVMGRLAEGRSIVAIDVSPEVDLRLALDAEIKMSAWWFLRQWLNPLSHQARIPHILNLLTRSSVIASIVASRQRSEQLGAGLYIKVPVETWKLLDFKSLDAIADLGHEATRDTIAKWWAETSAS